MKQVLQPHHRCKKMAASDYCHVSVSYRSRINSVLSFVHPSLLLFSSFYRSRFQKRKQYENNTERYVSIAGLIRGRQEEQGRIMGEAKGYPTKNITMT